MSLLGKQVFANPTTPIWGQGGGGGSNPTFQSVSFTPATGGVASSEISAGTNAGVGSTLVVSDGFTTVGPLVASALYTDQAFPRVIYQGNGIDYQQPGSGTSVFLATVSSGSNAWDLSNIASINGVPYANLPATAFDYSNYPGGLALAEAPNYTVLNSYSLTPPVNGKVYIESLASFVSVVNFAGVNMDFAINGSNVPASPTQTNAYASNVNFFGTNFFSFPVVANTTYDISSIAQCSALPPAGPDAVVNTSRLFVMFSPQ